jgi:hypothetical protein
MQDCVADRLVAAGTVLWLIRGRGDGPSDIRTQSRMWAAFDDVDSADVVVKGNPPPAPTPAMITQMDETLGWLQLIPDDQFTIRRVVAMRMLTNYSTERPVWTWVRMGKLLRCSNRALPLWHAKGVGIIRKKLVEINIREGRNNAYVAAPKTL